MKEIAKLPTETARDYALRAIRENIVSLDLEPGTGITRSQVFWV